MYIQGMRTGKHPTISTVDTFGVVLKMSKHTFQINTECWFANTYMFRC